MPGIHVCEAVLGDRAGGLVCVRLDPHEIHRGCTYESTSGVLNAVKEEL